MRIRRPEPHIAPKLVVEHISPCCAQSNEVVKLAGQTANDTVFRKPNHTIPLWQFVGDLADISADQIVALAEATAADPKFGFKGAALSAFAVIEGEDADLFRRMGLRAGSLLPETVQDQIRLEITSRLARVIPCVGKPLYNTNSNPLANWINLVFQSLSQFQPQRLASLELDVDPFAASLVVFDHVFFPNRSPKAKQERTMNMHFKVGLSFPGEKRAFVEEVAVSLKERLGNVFYDKFFEAELARPNLDVVLQKIYHDQCDLVVVFLCKDYERKDWCGLEWRAVRDLIKRRKDDSIMFMRFDNSDVPGVLSIDGYVDLNDRLPQDAVELICRRLETPSPDRLPRERNAPSTEDTAFLQLGERYMAVLVRLETSGRYNPACPHSRICRELEIDPRGPNGTGYKVMLHLMTTKRIREAAPQVTRNANSPQSFTDWFVRVL